MTPSKMILNNITFTTEANSLIIGEMKITTPMPGTIDILPGAPLETAHIILQKGDDTYFKSALLTSPVRPIDIIMYDQCGNISNKYLSTRTDNNSGSLKISAELKVLLSNIVFPTILTGQIYLVISNYSGLDQCSRPESKCELIKKDIEQLKESIDLSKVFLVIDAKINSTIESLGINLGDSFQTVHSVSSPLLIPYLVEYLAGKSIAGSKTSFQGFLNFGPDTEIVHCQFVEQPQQAMIEGQIRRNGRVQINSEGAVSGVRFCVMLAHKKSSDKPTMFVEEVTGTEFPIVHFADNLPNITADHLTTLVNGLNFMDRLTKHYVDPTTQVKSYDTLKKFILSNPVEVISYQFNSPLLMFEELDSKSNLSSMIIDIANSLQHNICLNIYTAAGSFISHRPKRTRETLFDPRNTKQQHFGNQAMTSMALDRQSTMANY